MPLPVPPAMLWHSVNPSRLSQYSASRSGREGDVWAGQGAGGRVNNRGWARGAGQGYGQGRGRGQGGSQHQGQTLGRVSSQ